MAGLFDASRHQVRERQEIGDANQRAAPAQDDLGIRGDEVGPLARHRADAIPLDAQQQPRAVPVVALADARELPSAERVEGVRHEHKARAHLRRACSSS